jgi:hypothetical protein
MHSNVRFYWTVYRNAENQHCLLVTKHRGAQIVLVLASEIINRK